MMSTPTPHDMRTGIQRRQELVSQVMDSLTGIEELSSAEQCAVLDETQQVLSGVLNNEAGLSQAGIPGLAHRG